RTMSNVLNPLFKVSVAKSGAAAISFLAKEHPDLILLDYQMPVCDGLQTLEMIRAEEEYKNIPVFFLTGVDDADLVKKAMALKPEGYILKSAGPELLISKIEAFF
ncbi:MAG: response regulator, partial [Treponema sp.]|nr:response regulator [Treponema sp.]